MNSARDFITGRIIAILPENFDTVKELFYLIKMYTSFLVTRGLQALTVTRVPWPIRPDRECI